MIKLKDLITERLDKWDATSNKYSIGMPNIGADLMIPKENSNKAALVWYNRKIYKVYWEDGMIQFKAQRGSKKDDETFKTIGKLEKWFNNMSVKPNPKKMYGKR